MILVVAALFSAAVFSLWRGGASLVRVGSPPAPLPSDRSRVVSSPSPVPQPSPTPQDPHTASPTLPPEVDLPVPFTVQAPRANWDDVHEDFCEEASVLMAASYVLGRDIPSADAAESEMAKIRAFEEERLGHWRTTTAEETAMILREYYGVADVALVSNPTAAMIREALGEGKVVIAPAFGRTLRNPFYTPPGPLYHMLVIKGYLRDGRFITNDPGTRRGEAFRYDPEVLLDAIHDFNGGDVENGRKVIIVVG
jgi:hypothetical protein